MSVTAGQLLHRLHGETFDIFYTCARRALRMSRKLGRSLGIRVETETVFWAVVEGSASAPVLVADGRIPAPVAADEAGKLVAQRRAVLDVIGKYTPTVLFVRFPETVFASRGESPRKRSRIEGVIMEAAASKSLPVRTGPLTTIGKGLGVDAKTAKAMRDHDQDLRGLDWSERDEYPREAIMAATAALS
jgi:hypothetical protein